MSIYVEQVMDYLDTHLVCRNADSMETLMEQLHEVYCMHNTVNHGELHELFREARDIGAQLGRAQYDAVYNLVCRLCLEHEQLAFAQGMLVGMMLMTEVNRLP